jgi:competence protein ComEA
MSPGGKKVLGAKWRALLVVAGAALVLFCIQGTAYPAAKADLVDINTATQAELEAVKGIGPVTAKKIIDNRPYKSLTDLKKAGLSAKEIKEFKPSLTAKPAPAPAAPATAAPPAKAVQPKTAAAAKEAKAPAAPVDLNSADQKALEALPGVGPALAKRIMEGRPFTSVDDLAKVKGLTKTKVAALKDKVTVGAAAPAAPAAPMAKPVPTAPPATPATPAPATEKPVAAPAPAAQPQPAAAAKEKKEAPKLAPGEKININTATAEELDKLFDIGPAKAKAIIEGRPYKTPEDIMKVKGIKEGIYDKIKDHITVQ